jgi:phosphatidate phosphatase PAH1
MNTEKIFSAVYRELIAHKTVELKSGILLTISSLFRAAGRVSKQEPFMMGFGNKATDADAYLLAGIPNSNILIIDPNSKIVVWQDFKDKSFNSYDDVNISQFVKDAIQSFNDLHI